MDHFSQPCPFCEKPVGDHTVREWSECVQSPTMDLPYEPVPDDAVGDAAQEAFRRQLGVEGDVLIADNVVAKAVRFDGGTIQIAGIVHEFSVAQLGGTPISVAKVLFISPPDIMRQYGDLIHAAANGAAG